MMMNGLQSDPDQPGCEKFVVADLNEKWLKEGRMRISSSDFGADGALMSPQCIFAVKGWNRSVCALVLLLATYEIGDALFDAPSSNLILKAPNSTINAIQQHRFQTTENVPVRLCRTM